MTPLTATQERTLLALSILGLLVPNGVFLWVAFARPAALEAALRNPAAAVFIAEAFFLMFLAAWLVGRAGLRRPGPLAFVALSLAGSLAFSVPLTLWLASRDARKA
ncbi:MAG: hypothetical protein IT452_01740 [Planctomycetia bacterium]|nr:hypothetical protein [Planctomycetia bacterium]